MIGVIVIAVLGARAEAGLVRRFCERYIVADAPISVMVEEHPLRDVTTGDLVARYRAEGGRAMWRRRASADLAHLGALLRLRDDLQSEIEQAMEDYGHFERWPDAPHRKDR